MPLSQGRGATTLTASSPPSNQASAEHKPTEMTSAGHNSDVAKKGGWSGGVSVLSARASTPPTRCWEDPPSGAMEGGLAAAIAAIEVKFYNLHGVGVAHVQWRVAMHPLAKLPEAGGPGDLCKVRVRRCGCVGLAVCAVRVRPVRLTAADCCAHACVRVLLSGLGCAMLRVRAWEESAWRATSTSS
jgi:hypothetical protein